MTEGYIVQQFLWSRIATIPGANWKLFPGWESETRPLYLAVPEQDAPELYAVLSIIGSSDVLTQGKSLEYTDFDVDLVVTMEERPNIIASTGSKGAPYEHLALAQVLHDGLTVPTTPWQITVGPPFAGTFDVTCDRISHRSFVTRENGVKQAIAQARYLVRVQRKID